MTVLRNPNEVIGKVYDEENYHCYHFIEECLDVPKLQDIHVATVKNDIIKHRRLFTKLKEPMDYAVAVLGDAHVGIYYNGGVFHNDTLGVRYEPMRTMNLKYKVINYYDICTD